MVNNLNISEFQLVIASNDDLSDDLNNLINNKNLNIEYHQNLSRTALATYIIRVRWVYLLTTNQNMQKDLHHHLSILNT